jgi:hypothetical protein
MLRVVAGLLLVFVCGCVSYHDVDFTKVIEAENFEWDGTMRLRRVQLSLLHSPGIDRIELNGKDGRCLLIFAEGGVRAYAEVKVVATRPAESEIPDENLQSVDIEALD